MQGPYMPQFLKDRLRDTAVLLGFAALFTFLGVYTSDGPLWLRYLMWFVTILTGGMSSMLAIPLVFERRIAGDHLPMQVIVASAIIAVPVQLSLYLFMGALGHWAGPEVLPLQFVYVYVVCLVMTFLGVLISRARRPHAVPAAEPDIDAVARFLDRLPVKYRGADLWAVSSEDHYLRVHTNRGEELILMRLADAVRELTGAEGVQVHRSWWVAKTGVGDKRRDNSKLVLVLKNGTEVPVSRTYVTAAREAGLA
ncbi:MAG: LytTR family DNA-binding domain-containing protein [Hyphomonas sp.]